MIGSQIPSLHCAVSKQGEQSAGSDPDGTHFPGGTLVGDFVGGDVGASVVGFGPFVDASVGASVVEASDVGASVASDVDASVVIASVVGASVVGAAVVGAAVVGASVVEASVVGDFFLTDLTVLPGSEPPFHVRRPARSRLNNAPLRIGFILSQYPMQVGLARHCAWASDSLVMSIAPRSAFSIVASTKVYSAASVVGFGLFVGASVGASVVGFGLFVGASVGASKHLMPGR